MGYAGLKSYGDSDNAAAFAYDVFSKVIKMIKKHLLVEGNNFNTDGIIDVCLFMEEFIYPINPHSPYDLHDEVSNVFDDIISILEKKIKKENKDEWEDETNKKYHISRYKELLNNAKKYRKRMC